MTDDRRQHRAPILFLARRNLRRTPVRTGLSIAAVVIGVVAVAGLGMAGTAFERVATDSLGTIGDDVVVTPAPESGRTTISTRDLQTIRRVAGEATVIPLSSHRTTVGHGATQRTTVAFQVAEPARLFEARAGRIPDRFRGGVLVGSALAAELEIRAGSAITVRDRSMRVRAVLARDRRAAVIDASTAVVLPRTGRDGSGVDRVVIEARTGTAANETAAAIRDAVNARGHRVTVLELATVREQVTGFFDAVDAFLFGIGGISLVVAGVSILNVQLLSTAERRAEIGLLRAVGYRRRDVLMLLLAEAGLLGIAGAFVGIAVTIAIGFVVASLAFDDPMVALARRNLGHLARAGLIAIGVSVAGGAYPAWKAAAERPVVALRD